MPAPSGRNRGIVGANLEGSTLFAGLDRTALDGLARLSRVLCLEAGKALFRQGDPSDGCFIVIEGVLRIATVSVKGEETLVAMLGSGDIVGEMGLIDGLPRSASAFALKPCTLAFLACVHLNRFADANPVVYRHMLQIISNRLRVTNDAFAAYQLLPLSGRLARIFLRLCEGVGQPLNDGRILLRQKITQAELARMTGSSRENVNRMLTRWRRERLVSRISGYYCIEKEARLRAMGGL